MYMEDEMIKSRTTLSTEYILSAVANELETAVKRYGPMTSPHEAYAVIYEEVVEYFDEVRKKPNARDKDLMRKELVQIAAMACRAIQDTCD
jgi:hypothetical protein